MKPDVAGLTAAIERLADPAERERLGGRRAGQPRALSWDRTVADYDALIEQAAAVPT